MGEEEDSKSTKTPEPANNEPKLQDDIQLCRSEIIKTHKIGHHKYKIVRTRDVSLGLALVFVPSECLGLKPRGNHSGCMVIKEISGIAAEAGLHKYDVVSEINNIFVTSKD